jgi:hypothetical protein
MTLRPNDDLDRVFNDGERLDQLPRRTKKRRKATGDRDVVRRKAFRVLAILADLPAGERLKVLKAAVRLNRA